MVASNKTVKVERFEDGTPMKFTSIGLYPIFYVTGRNDCLCPACAGNVEKENPMVATDANWENPSLYCDVCSERIESAHAED